MSAPGRGIEVREAGADDLVFLREMFLQAFFWRPARPIPPLEEALADPHLARYVDGWGRAGDMAVIAIDAIGLPLGAAWSRLFTTDEPGYGFVDPATPEIGIAVLRDRRGGGIGGRLLGELVRLLRRAGYVAVSLSVERDNPARRLYERQGFLPVESTADAITMILHLDRPVLPRR